MKKIRRNKKRPVAKTKKRAKKKAAARAARKARPARHVTRTGKNASIFTDFPEYPPLYDIASYRWYGFDLDGTIADNTHHGSGMGVIGMPVNPMVALMKRLHKQNKRVKIVTARLNDVGPYEADQCRVKEHIWEWCDKYLGFRPEITDRKDSSMEGLYDDRARQVVRNKGVDVYDLARELAKALDNELRNPMCNRKALSVLRYRCIEYGLLA